MDKDKKPEYDGIVEVTVTIRYPASLVDYENAKTIDDVVVQDGELWGEDHLALLDLMGSAQSNEGEDGWGLQIETRCFESIAQGDTNGVGGSSDG